MYRKDIDLLEFLIEELKKMEKGKVKHSRENIKKLEDEVKKSSKNNVEHICYILEGTFNGISLEQAVNLFERLKSAILCCI